MIPTEVRGFVVQRKFKLNDLDNERAIVSFGANSRVTWRRFSAEMGIHLNPLEDWGSGNLRLCHAVLYIEELSDGC